MQKQMDQLKLNAEYTAPQQNLTAISKLLTGLQMQHWKFNNKICGRILMDINTITKP